MVCLFVCGSVPKTAKKMSRVFLKMDYRKADPTYVNFVPRTAADAIDKFHRYKKRGVPPNLWPEVFVECATELPEAELDKFEAWLVNPNGACENPATVSKARWVDTVNAENEVVRKQLLKESQARDAPPLILEHYMEEDEKTPDPDPEVSETISSMMVNMSVDNDLDMVTVLVPP